MTNQLQRKIANLRNSIHMETLIFVKIEKQNLAITLQAKVSGSCGYLSIVPAVHFPYRIMQALPPLNF